MDIIERPIRTFGFAGWKIIDEKDRVPCLNEEPGYLIVKDGKSRWIRKERV